MITYELCPTLSFAQATQRVFMRTGFLMFPRRGDATRLCAWVYDMPEDVDHSKLTGLPLLTNDEIHELGMFCGVNLLDHNLWHMILMWIQQLPNQERFRKATFLQPQVLASNFYWATIKHMTYN